MKQLGMTFFAGAMVLAAACGGGTADLGGGGASSSSSSGGAADGGDAGNQGGSSSGTSGSLPPADPIATDGLAGIWDVTGAEPGSPPTTGTIEISATRFVAEFAPSSLTMILQAGGTVVTAWQKDAFNGTDISTTRSDIPFDTGALPLPLGGMWAFTSPTAGDSTQCTGNLSASAFNGGCNATVSGRPGVVPSMRGSAVANKTASLPSSFGDFGGKWEFTGDAAGCIATFEQNTAKWTCPKNGGWGGNAEITFTPTTASGSSSAGVQFSALKR
jgi:hypothetical protein